MNRATVRKEIEILNDTLQIGRVADNDVVIPDKRLSGKHCKIVRRIDAEGKMSVHIEDSSSNGTFHNKKQVSSTSISLMVWVGLTRMSNHIDRER